MQCETHSVHPLDQMLIDQQLAPRADVGGLCGVRDGSEDNRRNNYVFAEGVFHDDFVILFDCARLASVRCDLDLRQIDRRFAFVGRVVTDPQQVIVPDQTGIAGVAAGRES